MRTIELAVRFGKLVIIDEVTSVDPVIYPIIRRSFFSIGTRSMVQLGDKQIEVNDQFQLFFVTRQNNFFLPLELQGLMPEINFTVTKAGLSSQLLDLIITVENPQLETERIELIKKEEVLNHTLVGLEDSLLQELANSVGNILENRTLVHSLNETKAKSESIQASLRDSTALQNNFDSERNKFAAVATTGSSIYFTLMNFSKINHMYQFSLNSFIQLFKKSITKTNSSSTDSTLRLKEMRRSVLASTYSYFSRSLLNEDRLKLAISMIYSDYPELFRENEWEVLIGLDSYDGEPTVKAPAWVPSGNISTFQKLLTLIPSLVNTMNMENTGFWNSWMTSSACELSWGDLKINPIQKILLIKSLRPDRFLAAVSLISMELLGITSISPPISYSELVKENGPSDFSLFIVTPGVDPSLEIKESAKSFVGEENYHQIAMGQGQGDKAIALLKECAEKGAWMFLQNLHLVINWIPILEAELGSLVFHQNFRLFISTEEHLKFPFSLLCKCVKITVQAPPGIKRNLERTYENWNADFIQSGNLFRAQVLFGLAWFHSIVQERRNYLPQGWIKFYEFSLADLKSTALLISDMFKITNSKPSWEVVRGLIHEAIYGGRIDIATDYVCLKTFLEMFFRSDYYRHNDVAPKKKFHKIIDLPNKVDRDAFIELIKLLPERDDVQTLGLPANTDQMVQQTITTKIIESLKLLVLVIFNVLDKGICRCSKIRSNN
jgi:dynein heavy chain 2